MPEQSHPPYAPTATFQPRQLNRWLDINAQNGPLSRTQTYITLPAFSIAFTWRGYSDIVAAFNFEGPNNFSFRLNYITPTAPNYTLCVMWKDGNNITYRYSLWRAAGDVIFSDITPYTGQLIKKNFRFEVWSTASTPAVNLSPINIYTSVLGILDYRYGLDSTLITTDGLVTLFGALASPVSPLPNNGQNELLNHFISTANFAGTTWTSINDITAITSAGAIQSAFVSGPYVYETITTTGAGLSGATSGSSTVNFVCMVFYADGSSGILCKYNNSPTVSTTATGITVGTDIVPYPFGIGHVYFMFVDFVDGLVSFYDVLSVGNVVQTGITPSVPTGSTTLQILDAGSTIKVIEMFSYFNLQAIQPLIDYITTEYSNFNLPLIFPANSSPQQNP